MLIRLYLCRHLYPPAAFILGYPTSIIMSSTTISHVNRTSRNATLTQNLVMIRMCNKRKYVLARTAIPSAAPCSHKALKAQTVKAVGIPHPAHRFVDGCWPPPSKSITTFRNNNKVSSSHHRSPRRTSLCHSDHHLSPKLPGHHPPRPP